MTVTLSDVGGFRAALLDATRIVRRRVRLPGIGPRG